MPELIDNYKIYLYSGINDEDVTDKTDYIPFTNDYSNVIQFDTSQARDTYFEAIPHYEINHTDDYKVYLNGATIKIAFGSFFNIDCDYSQIKYMRIDSIVENIVTPKISTKYYFVNSYEIVSAYANVTIVVFNIEYDYWTNNQFDFVFRESNIERMHVDRWDSDGKMLYTKPILDAIDCNMKVENTQTDSGQTFHVNGQDITVKWAIVSAIHSFAKDKDQMLHHIIPINISNLNKTPYKWDDISVLTDGMIMGSMNGNTVYMPSLNAISNGYLLNALGNDTEISPSTTRKDSVSVVNIQMVDYLPLELNYGEYTLNANGGDVVVTGYYLSYDSNILPARAGAELVSLVPPITLILASFYVSSLSIFTDYNVSHGCQKIFNLTSPLKAIDNANYNEEYEPALYMPPVRRRYISSRDNSAMSEIPYEVLRNIFSKPIKNSLVCHNYISFSSTALYTYIILEDYTREELNKIGFAFNKISYMLDFISDAWATYCVTQRDSDRAMMWTNIVTGGISELGSTAVSAGIGYRSNMERAYVSQYAAQYNNSQAAVYDALSSSANPNISNAKRARYADLSGDYGMKAIPINKAVGMYKGMAGSAMSMSGIGGVTAFSANAIHQGMAQRTKERSVQNTPGTLASAGNTLSSIINDEWGTVLTELKCDDFAYEQYKNLFMKYGYYYGGVAVPNIKSRKYFNYIKTNGAILTGNVNNLILAALANIFDTGVTIWHADYCISYGGQAAINVKVYDYTKENIERSLI